LNNREKVNPKFLVDTGCTCNTFLAIDAVMREKIKVTLCVTR
jgi:predicted aspartyl protease